MKVFGGGEGCESDARETAEGAWRGPHQTKKKELTRRRSDRIDVVIILYLGTSAISLSYVDWSNSTKLLTFSLSFPLLHFCRAMKRGGGLREDFLWGGGEGGCCVSQGFRGGREGRGPVALVAAGEEGGCCCPAVTADGGGGEGEGRGLPPHREPERARPFRTFFLPLLLLAAARALASLLFTSLGACLRVRRGLGVGGERGSAA